MEVLQGESAWTETMIASLYRLVSVLALAVHAFGGAPAPRTLNDLTFLTRDGCVNTPDMVNNLDDALTALNLPKDYQYINISTLPAMDVRTGYPTPTILWKRQDVFGMPVPKPPFAAPS